MAALDFSAAFDDEEDEKIVVEEQPSTSTSTSKFDDAFEEDDDKPVVAVSEQADVSQPTVSRFSDVFADDDDTDTDTVTEPAPVAETPEQILARTGEVPEGFKSVPQVPTGDAPEDYLPRLEPIDAPTPTVSEQTDAVFNYEDTAAAASVYNADVLGVDKFVDENISEPFKPAARWLGKATNKDLMNLAVGYEFAKETVENAGAALTIALKEVGVDMPSSSDPKKSGEKFAQDIEMMLETTIGLPIVRALAPVRKLAREVKQDAKLKAKGEKARAKLLDRKMNINKAKEATAE